jgi:hypothetical protein
MDYVASLPNEYITEVGRWLGESFTNPADIETILKGTGVAMGKIDLRSNAEICWNSAVGRVTLEGRFNLLLNQLTHATAGTELATKVQEFSIKYDKLILAGFTQGIDKLQKALDEIVRTDEPQKLAKLSGETRERVTEIRSQIDNDAHWLKVPFVTSGYYAEDIRGELSSGCLQVVAAADGLIYETRILARIADNSLTEDPEAVVRRERQQLRSITQAKITLAEKGRRFIKEIHAATPLKLSS